jgi:hypothetical protein
MPAALLAVLLIVLSAGNDTPVPPGTAGTFARPIDFTLALDARPSVVDATRIRSRAARNNAVWPSRVVYRYLDAAAVNAAKSDADLARLLAPVTIDARTTTARSVESIVDLTGVRRGELSLRLPAGRGVNIGGVDVVGRPVVPVTLAIKAANVAVRVVAVPGKETGRPVDGKGEEIKEPAPTEKKDNVGLVNARGKDTKKTMGAGGAPEAGAQEEKTKDVKGKKAEDKKA